MLVDNKIQDTGVSNVSSPTVGSSSVMLSPVPENNNFSVPPTNPQPPRRLGNKKNILKIISLIFFILLLIIGGFLVAINMSTRKKESSNQVSSAQIFDNQQIQLSGLGSSQDLSLVGTRSLTVNGDLVSNGSLTISPSGQPSNATPGQIYFDENTNELAYFNGSEFISVGQSVTTLQGQTGNITLVAGPGMAVDGTTLSNTGVTSVGNQTGDITIGTGLTATDGILQNSGVISATGGTGITVTNDGAGNITITNSGAGSGTVNSPGGTTGRIAKFTGAQTIADSILFESGSTVTVNGSLAVTSDLTLGTALSVGNGGTGNTSLAANGVVVGNGSGSLTAVAAGAAGQCLMSTAGTPAFQACPGSGGVTTLNGLSGALTLANASAAGSTITINDASTSQKGIAQFNATNFSASSGSVNTVQDIHSGASPSFVGVTLSGDLAVNGNDITSTGTLNVTPSSALTLGSTSQAATLQGNASTIIRATNSGNTTTLSFVTPTANTTVRIPALSAGTYDICTSSGNCSGASVTLQGAYDNSTSPEITLDTTRGALTVRDNATPLGANLLEVQNNAGSTTYFAVTSGGSATTGSVSATSNINSSSGTLQTAGINRVDNSGNLVNIGNLTATGAITIASSGAGNDIVINGADILDVQDAATFAAATMFNGLTTFNTDVDFTLAETENINIANTITGTNSLDLISSVLTNNSGSGTQRGALLQNAAGSGSTEALLVLDNADTDTALVAGLQITAAAGTVTTAIDLTDADIDTALNVGANNILGTTGNLDFTNFDVLGGSGNITAGTYNGQTISSAANFTGTLAVAGNSTLSGDLGVNGGDLTSSGTLNITPGGALTIGATGQILTLQGTNGTTITATSGANTTTLGFAAPTANTTLNLPALAAGTYTVCTTSGNCAGAGVTLQAAYNNSASPEITLDATRGALTLRDSSGGLGANLFEVQNNAGGTTYFAVSASGTATTGSASATGNINSSGGTLQTNGTTRLDNSGNLTNIGTITSSGATTLQGGLLAVGTTSQAGTATLHDGNGQATTLQTGDPTTDRTITLGDESGTICLQGSINCGFAAASGNTNYIQNQTAADQTANFRISGTGRINTALVSPAWRPITNSTTALSIQNAAGSSTVVSIDTTNSRVGFGGSFAPEETVDVVGNLIVKDAASDTKSLRLRTNGIGVDLEGAAAPLILSVWQDAAYATTQYHYLTMESSAHVAQATGSWQFRTVDKATTRHTIDGTAGTNVAFNQNGEATNFTIQGDTDTTLFFVQGSTDRIGIGTNTPGYKLDVAGDINSQATLRTGASSVAGSLVISDGSSNTGTLQTASLGQNTTYTLPDPGSASATICLTTGNCAGTGGGVTGSGTNNRITKFTSTGSTVGNSTITDDGTSVTTTVDVVIQGGDLTIGGTAQLASLLLHDGNGQTTTLQAGNSGSDLTFILPTTTGSTNQCLKQSGTGNQLFWDNCDGGGGGVSATLQTAYNNGISGIITTTDNRDIDIVLANTATDANLDLSIADGSSGFVSFTRANGSGTADPAQILLVDNLDADRALPIGVKLQAAGGGMTTAIDATDAEIVDAISVAGNNIVGTTGNIDFSNFDVVGATGNITAGTLNGQTISSTASFTGTLAVAGNTTLTGDIAVNGGDLTSTGALNITPTGALSLGSTAQAATLQGNASTTIEATDSGNTTTIAFTTPTADATLNFPALSAGTYNICTSSGNCAGAGVTLQAAYNNSSSPEMTLDATRGALSVRDASSALGANLFEVQNNAGSTTYFAVTASGTSVTGSASATGNVNSSSGSIQTSGTTRIDNSGNLSNIGNLTGSGALTIASSGAGNDIIINGADILDVQDAATFASTSTFNGTATFNTDVDFTLAETENISIANTVTGSNSLDLISGVLTNNTSSGTQRAAVLQNAAGSGSTEALLTLDNADTDTALVAGLQITAAAGGITTAIDASDSDIVTALSVGANDIVGTTGNLDFTNFDVLGASGNITAGTYNGQTISSAASFTGTVAVSGNTTLTGDLAVNGGDITSSGALNITSGGLLTVGATTQNLTLQGAAGTTLTATSGSNTTTLAFTSPTANTTLNLPALSAGTYEICTTSGNCAGAGVTLQLAYNNSTSPEITVDATRGAVTIRDASSALGANLFEVQNNAGNTTYLAVTASGISVGGTIAATGNINSSGGALQTASTNRIDNSGNLVNIGNLTATGAITIASSGAGNDIVINGADTLDIQDATTFASTSGFNGVATFNTDVDFTLAETENLNLTNTVTGTNGLDLLSGVLTNNTSSGTQRGAVLQNAAGSGTTETLLTLDNADTDTALVAGLQITAAAGGLTTAIDASDSDIVTALSVGANDILGTTGSLDFTNFDVVGTSGNITAGTYNGQTISSAANFTGTLAVTGNTTLTGNLAVNGGDITSTGALNITPGGLLTVGATNQNLTLQGAAGTTLTATSGSNTTTFGFTSPTANTTLNLPALSAGTYEICTNSGNCAGAGVTLQAAYNNSSSPEITVDATRGAVTIRDASSALGANLFEVQNNAGSTTYFAVTATGSSTTGAASATGNINSSGGAIQTGGTTRIDNSGNLTNIGTLSLSGAISGGTSYSGSGNINTTGGALQTNSTTRVDNSGNLANIGNITATGATTIASSGAGNDITIDGADQFIVQDAAVFNAAATFNSDIDITLAETENVSFTNTVTGSNSLDLISALLTNNTSSGTQRGLVLQNTAGSGTTESLVLLDNADTDTSLTTGLQITSAAGGIATAIDLTDADIVDALSVGANNIAGTTGNLDFTNFDVVGSSGDTTVAGTLTVTDALTSLTGATSGDALNVSNSTSSGNIAVFNDNSTAVVTFANGGSALFRNETNSATAFRVQNATGADTLFTVDTAARSASGGNLIKIGNSTGTDTNTTFLVLDGSTADPSTNVSALNGGMFYDSDDHKVKLIENGLVKTICNTTDLGCGTGTVTLQSAYNNGNSIDTTDGRSITLNLTEQTTDPSFLIDLQCDTSCSTNGKFAVQDDGSDVLTILPAAGGITIGSSSLNTALTLNSGTGTISIGTGAEARTINFGTGAAVIQTINIGGTGANVIAIGNTQTGGSIALGAAMTTGTITIGGTGAQTGTINIGTGTGVQALNFGTGGTGAKTVTIGSTATSSVTTIQGDGGTANGDINIGDQTTAGKILDLGSVTNAGTGTVNIATATGAAQTVNIGSTAASSVLSLNAGSGNATFNATSGTITIQTTTSGQINIKPGGSSNIVLGTSDTTGTLLVLDDKTSSGDPTGVLGGMYYNSNVGKFRCFEKNEGTSGYWRDCIASARTTYSYTAEMTSASADHEFTFDGSGGGGTDDGVGGAANHPGIVRMGTGTGSTNWIYAGARNSGSNIIRLANNDYWRYEAVTRITTLSDGTNRFIYRLGFIDNVTDGTDGCFLKYSDNVNSGRWQGLCISGGTSSTCDTGITVATGTWYRLNVVVNTAGTSVDFQTDGTSRCQVTTNIPTGSGNLTAWGATLSKSLGTTDRTVDLDYISIYGQMGTSR